MLDTSKLRLDDLQTGNLKLYQDPVKFCFGIDAVLLANFASMNIKKGARVVDLCTGNGIIPILLTAKTKVKEILGVEIDEESSSLAKLNVKHNSLEEVVTIIKADAKKLDTKYNGHFDALTINPPYIPLGKGLVSEEKLSVARHEIALSLYDAIKTGSKLLKDKGKFFIVHKAHRSAEIISIFKECGIEAKKLQFIQPKADANANLVLVCGAKNSGAWIDVLPPIIVYNQDGTYTEQIDEIYNRS